MKTFKNTNFTKRNSETTNLVFCQATKAPAANWIECDEEEIAEMNCTQLYRKCDVRYFGYL